MKQKQERILSLIIVAIFSLVFSYIDDEKFLERFVTFSLFWPIFYWWFSPFLNKERND